MSFMQQQVRGPEEWFMVETKEGTYYYPKDEMSRDEIEEEWNDKIELKPSGEPDIEVIEGYGARLSAPGYLDCTDWAVFATEEEATEYLEEMYGDDEL